MITAANYIDNYKIHFDFSDRKPVDFDFEPFLKSNKNKMNTQFLSLELFQKFTVSNGIISWDGPNGEMDFDQEHLAYINPE